MGDALDSLMSQFGGASSGTVNKVYTGRIDPNAQGFIGPVANESLRTGITTVAEAKKMFYSWSDKELNAFKSKLSSYGFKNVSNVMAATLWETAVDGASTWYSNSDGKRKITPEEYIQWYAKGQGLTSGNETTKTKNVYLYDKAAINDLVKKTVSDTLGREPSNDEMKHFYTVVKDMIDEGTVTTTKMVNGTSVTTTKPGFSTEKATAAIEGELKTTSAEDYKQKQSLEFGDFLAQLEK
jgi:hypothetical protein